MGLVFVCLAFLTPVGAFALGLPPVLLAMGDHGALRMKVYGWRQGPVDFFEELKLIAPFNVCDTIYEIDSVLAARRRVVGFLAHSFRSIGFWGLRK